MKLQIFAVFDVKAEVYSSPSFLPNRGLALRSLSDIVADPSTGISQHPEDYSLYKLGEFDNVSGVITPVSGVPELIARASEFKKEV